MSQLFSIRMRASSENAHAGGAERITGEGNFEPLLREMILRGLSSCLRPDEIVVNVEAIDPGSVLYCNSMDVRTYTSSSHSKSLMFAKDILKLNGIPCEIVESAFQLLQAGPTPEGNNMRGAVIMDAFTGERIEPDARRGVRVTRVDYSDSARTDLDKKLSLRGINHGRVMEGLAIATKVSSRKETIAELCWSDNPEYTTGYIASRQEGYLRITRLKEEGSIRGGRVFFVNPECLQLEQYINYLEKQPVIIDQIGEVSHLSS